MALELRYSVFLIFLQAIHLQGGLDIRIWPYLSSRAINKKKGTLPSPTFFPILPKIRPVSPRFAPIYPNSSPFVPNCPDLPTFSPIRHNPPQFAPISSIYPKCDHSKSILPAPFRPKAHFTCPIKSWILIGLASTNNDSLTPFDRIIL